MIKLHESNKLRYSWLYCSGTNVSFSLFLIRFTILLLILKGSLKQAQSTPTQHYDVTRLPRRPSNIESLNFEYENAYTDNTFKETCIIKPSLRLLASGSRPIGVGCGAGVVVADMLSQAEHDVVEFNISPKMVQLAQSRVKDLFTFSDLLSYDPDGQSAAVSGGLSPTAPVCRFQHCLEVRQRIAAWTGFCAK